ncbi:Membrane associated serine protease, rhomboid family [Jatrophihabitans endophyticus]|uniref:Membrane associated serine protease, rhomboid family n=1 Tax=Jatrophihabitans endophyticus TaxID=1206085 RepID=A0A1M5HXN3_9ACTN|nr:rhomboid family intramembrane serine protease [Jatrophihabitans endophyticus]SHG20632.1 Membrane associated serine protease, rhomboid family [Jatrophihabitans endophyticus]
MTLPDGTGAGTTELAHCYRHPNRETGVRCVRCDRPICPECMRPASVGFHCPDDARSGARSIRPQRTSVGARILRAPPFMTAILVALNVVGYLATGLQHPGTLRDPTNSQLFIDLQLFPPRVDGGDYYQLLTSAFLHLDPLHIAANMLALVVLGPPLERLLGWWRFGAVYLLGALGGGAAVYAFGDELAATAGASGAIFGLFGAGLLLVRRLGFDPRWLIATIGFNFAITFSVAGISRLGHIGGFVTGVLCAVVIGGLPHSRARVPTRLQVGGLVGVLVLAVVVVVVRTATFS